MAHNRPSGTPAVPARMRMESDERRARRARRWKAVLRVGACLAGTGLLLEFGMRFVLFAPEARALGIGWRLRNPALFTAPEVGRETWKLRAELGGSGVDELSADERFGWLRPTIDPVTLANVGENELRGRRPLLFFGDSFTRCSGESCWEDLLEETELASEFRLLNYGVGGYGVGQMRLLMDAVLDRFQPDDPRVIVGILVDDDLDRSYLPLRDLPKPYFTVSDGELVHHPIEQGGQSDYLRTHPLGIRSYFWRWFLFGTHLVPRRLALALTGQSDHVAIKEELNRLLLLAMRDDLRARGLDYFIVLFHAREGLDSPGPYGWQEPFLYRTFEELGIPFVSSKRALRDHMARTGTSVDDYYYASGPAYNHYTPLANRVVFTAIREGLEGIFETSDYLARR